MNRQQEVFQRLNDMAVNGSVKDYSRGVADVIATRLGIKKQYASILLAKLEEAGYIERIPEGRGGKIVEVILKKDQWGKKASGEKKPTPKPNEETPPQRRDQTPPATIVDLTPIVEEQRKITQAIEGIRQEIAEQREAKVHKLPPPAVEQGTDHAKFVILVDWRNLAMAFPTYNHATTKLLDLENGLRRYGTIEAKFLFTPNHGVDTATDLVLKHRYFAVMCPKTFRNGNGNRYKDVDMVDSRLTEFGKLIASFNQHITHIVLVAGDRDYVDLVTIAKDHGKTVWLGAHENTSQALWELADKVIILYQN